MKIINNRVVCTRCEELVESHPRTINSMTPIEKLVPIEQLIPAIVKALQEISEWPWKIDQKVCIVTDQKSKCVSVSSSFAISETNMRTNNLFTAASPLWLASLVVRIVEERAWLKADGNGNPQYDVALYDFGLAAEDWEWLKGKMRR